jgi:hypothetical protein
MINELNKNTILELKPVALFKDKKNSAAAIDTS